MEIRDFSRKFWDHYYQCNQLASEGCHQEWMKSIASIQSEETNNDGPN